MVEINEPDAGRYVTGSLWSDNPYQWAFNFNTQQRNLNLLDRYSEDLQVANSIAAEIANRDRMVDALGKLSTGRDSISNYADMASQLTNAATGMQLQPGELQGVMDVGRAYQPITENVLNSARAAEALAGAGQGMPGGISPDMLRTGELSGTFMPGTMRGGGGGGGGSNGGKYQVTFENGVPKVQFTGGIPNNNDLVIMQSIGSQAGSQMPQAMLLAEIENQFPGATMRRQSDGSVVVESPDGNVLVTPDGQYVDLETGDTRE